MAANTVTITLTAKDGASQTFKAVSREAQALDKSLDQVGSRGSRSLSGLTKAGAALGAGFSVVTGALGEASRLAAESEASQARLETAIETTGHSLIEYEEQLSAASQAALQLGFDDEDAADSIALLTTATGDAERAIADLAIAEDLARARGISLESATKLVVAAEQERYGALARAGIVIDENASKEEALAQIRAQTAGQAEAYAETSQGAIDRVTNAIENQAEAVGAAIGPFQSLFALAPAIGPAFSGAATAIGALAGALGPVGLVAAAVGAAGALLYFASSTDGSFTPSIERASDEVQHMNDLLIQNIRIGSKLVPLNEDTVEIFKYLEGAAGDYETKLHDLRERQEEANRSAVNSANDFSLSAEAIEEQRLRAIDATRDLINYQNQQGKNAVNAEKFEQASAAVNDVLENTGPAAGLAQDILDGLNKQQQDGTLSWAAYIDKVIDLGEQLPIMTRNMIESAGATDEQSYATQQATRALDDYSSAQAAALTVQTNELAAVREQAAAQNELNRQKAEYRAFSTVDVQAQELNALIASNAALREQEGAYYGLRDGITSANDAQAIFKQTQDGLIESQQPYTHQLSEYQTQLGYINDAVDLLNERQAEGQTLTQDQTDFLADATWAQERLTGGTEDATLALGEQALQYAENMRIGDEMNQKMGDQVGATQTLTDTMNNLIATLQGMPGYVSTTINIDAEAALNQLNHVRDQLDALNGKTSYASVVVTGYYTGPNVGLTPGFALGGMIDAAHEPQHAQHGAALRGWSWVGEAGPELIRAPGAQVMPHTASMAVTAGGGGGQVYHINRMTVVANDPVQFNAKMRSYTAGLER